MGFYIQDDYYTAAVEELTPREQEQYWGALIRYFFDPDYDMAAERLPKAVRGMVRTSTVRIDKAKAEADRKRTKRGKSADNPRTVRGQSANYPSKNQESEREREIVVDDVISGCNPLGPDEIATEPDGFPAFMAGCVKAYNAATGQAYAFPNAAARQGMLDAFRAGRTLADVERVMADVAGWERRYQTLDAVFADGKFEKHLNREGGERRDWSVYNDLAI